MARISPTRCLQIVMPPVSPCSAGRVLSSWVKLLLLNLLTPPLAPPSNPLNLDHTPGGSSSGSAAAVAAGMVDFALGTQTGGLHDGALLRLRAFWVSNPALARYIAAVFSCCATAWTLLAISAETSRSCGVLPQCCKACPKSVSLARHVSVFWMVKIWARLRPLRWLPWSKAVSYLEEQGAQLERLPADPQLKETADPARADHGLRNGPQPTAGLAGQP